MTSRERPEWSPIDPTLWQKVLAFLLERQTGRVTLHVERGVVQLVEVTAFTRKGRENPVDIKESIG